MRAIVLGAWLAHRLGVPAHAPAGTWLLRLFVLPPAQTQRLPEPLERGLGAVETVLVRELQVRAPGSWRDWLRAIVLVEPEARPPSLLARAGAALWLLVPEALRLPAERTAVGFGRAAHARSMGEAEYLADQITRNPVIANLTIVVGAAVLLFAASTPMDLSRQLVLFGLMWALSMLVRRLPGNIPTLVLVSFSAFASARYIFWRVTQTLDLQHGASSIMGIGLIAAECYTWAVLIIGYAQNAWPLHRQPHPLPRDPRLWPSVDVFIPTYHEPLAVVKPALLAALTMDWPADRLKVYLLDDGNRPEFARCAADFGAYYITRPNNLNAKAGNLNHGLGLSSGEFIAMFDCDHVPVRSFLQTTMGWFLRDRRCAVVQTPHHFFSPDPFEKNLGTFHRIPNEGSLFYGLVQDGNDLWNSAFFCGSCAVLRRSSLLEVDGVATDTVTEDAHTALKLHRHGYSSAYLGITQAAGLATESLSSHIGQRMRWARGMAQVFRIDNPLLGRGLTAMQRLCYSNAMLHFFYGLPRLVFLTAPLAFLYFQLHIINAAASTLAVYVLPHLVQANLANSRMQGRFRHSFWAEAYETVLSWYIILPTTVAMINPRAGGFNVTVKGGLTSRGYFDWGISMPYIGMAVVNIIGVAVGVARIVWWNPGEFGTVFMNMAWALFNCVMLGNALGVAAEARQVRTSQRVPMRLPASLYLPDGRVIACHTTDYSAGGVGLELPAEITVPQGVPLDISIRRGEREFALPCQAAAVFGKKVGLSFPTLTPEQEKDLIACTFGRADAWLDWDANTPKDRPLLSMLEVLHYSALGYRNLLGSLRVQLFGKRTKRRPAPEPQHQPHAPPPRDVAFQG
jgi:cellulose synthase (UDP-forming)